MMQNNDVGKRKRQREEEVDSVSSADDGPPNVWQELNESAKKILKESSIYSALKDRETLFYPALKMSNYDIAFAKHIEKTYYKNVDILTLLGTSDAGTPQRASTRGTRGRGTGNWVTGGIWQRYLGLLRKRQQGDDIHIVGTVISLDDIKHAQRRRKGETYPDKFTCPYQYHEIPKTVKSKILVSLFMVSSHAYACRVTKRTKQIECFTTGGPTVVATVNTDQLRTMCGTFLALDKLETWSCTLQNVLDQNPGDCVVWGLQFVNCLSSDHQHLGWLSTMGKDTTILRYFMLCELAYGRVLEWKKPRDDATHQIRQNPPKQTMPATRCEKPTCTCRCLRGVHKCVPPNPWNMFQIAHRGTGRRNVQALYRRAKTEGVTRDGLNNLACIYASSFGRDVCRQRALLDAWQQEPEGIDLEEYTLKTPPQTQSECGSKWGVAYRLTDALGWPDDPFKPETPPRPAVLRQCARIVDTVFFEGTLFKRGILSCTEKRGVIKLDIVIDDELDSEDDRVAVTYKEDQGTIIALYRPHLQQKWEEKGSGYFCIYDFTPRSIQHVILHCVARQLLHAIDAYSVGKTPSRRSWADAQVLCTHILGSGVVSSTKIKVVSNGRVRMLHRPENKETWNWAVPLQVCPETGLSHKR